MLSVPDLALIGAAALIFFGPDKLPGVARKAGQMVREIQMTSQSFVREMERAADEAEERERLREFAKNEAAPAESITPEIAPHEFPLHGHDDYGVSDVAPAQPAATNGASSAERAAPAPPAHPSDEGFHGPEHISPGP